MRGGAAPSRRAARAAALLLLALAVGLAASLSACGKKGHLEPPQGKKSEYPRTYPNE